MADLNLSIAALSVLALTIQLLLLQIPKAGYLQPLLIVLTTLAIIVSGPLIFQLLPTLTYFYIAALPVAFLALLPSLYLYTQALTQNHAWHTHWRHIKLYWTQILAIPLALLVFTLPVEDSQSLFFGDPVELRGQVLVTAICFLLATGLWLAQSLHYLVKISVQLRNYRQHLRQVFAADSGKRLGWLDILVISLLASWSYAVLVFLIGERVASPWLSESGVMLVTFMLVWLLCSCGLRQQPGFAELYTTTDLTNLTEPTFENSAAADPAKYQRSALGDSQAQRIADKVRHAVYHETLYLDPELSLYKLAEHLGVPAQYLSQTLNQTLQQSFYDYINEARIAAAKRQLEQTDDSVLTIAMAVGFNARSSFYKAFNASTGLTPMMYRKQQRKRKAIDYEM